MRTECVIRSAITFTLTMTMALTMAGVVTKAIVPGSASAADPLSGIRCVRLFSLQHHEILINACDVCRRVGVQRDRPGAHFPTARTVVVPEQSQIELSFLGPGRTRLTSEELCRAAEPAGAGTRHADGRRCVQFARTGDAHLLVNGCGECRAVTIVRTDSSGGQSRSNYVVGPRSTLPYPSDGAVNASIAGETGCR